MNICGKSPKIALLPFPWCTSTSMMAMRLTFRAFNNRREATAISLNTQNPSPASYNAWCVPPARFPERPSSRAISDAETAPPTVARERFTRPAVNGNPILRTIFGSSVKSHTDATYLGSCASNNSSGEKIGDSCNSVVSRIFLSNNASLINLYLDIGNLCPSGRGMVYVSE